jgi:hypothetical protein
MKKQNIAILLSLFGIWLTIFFGVVTLIAR